MGKLPCLEISSSVTAFGREMIELTKAKVRRALLILVEVFTVGNRLRHNIPLPMDTSMTASLCMVIRTP